MLAQFRCLGADCEDTCCRGWDMQLDAAHYDLYRKEKPELLEAVVESDSGFIMKRDAGTDYCVKYSSGLCGIHKEMGEKFLGDACHFYPRSTRRYGGALVMAAAFSCPEVVRLAEANENAFALEAAEFARLPEEVKDYLPEGMDEEGALSVMEAFCAHLAREDLPPEVSLMMLLSVARSMDSLPKKQWRDAVPFYLRTALERLQLPQPQPANPYRLVHMLHILLLAMPKVAVGDASIEYKSVERPRLKQTMEEMLAALDAEIDPQTHMIRARREDFSAYEELKVAWEAGAQGVRAPLLRRWLQGQVRLHGFPFAGMGENVAERAMFLAIRFALTRLALMAAERSGEKQAHIRAVQSLARVIDHLAGADLLRQIGADAGWMNEQGAMGLVAG